MITKTYIQENLRQLDTAFRKTKHNKHALYFSKLAVLELCGWIEMSMDDLVSRHGNRNLKVQSNLKFVNKGIIEKTHGFDYESNFRLMLIKLVGVVTCEQLELAIDPGVDLPFRSQLTSLKTARNRLAHTYVKGPAATYNIDAPSVTKARFADLYRGLRAYDTALQAI